MAHGGGGSASRRDGGTARMHGHPLALEPAIATSQATAAAADAGSVPSVTAPNARASFAATQPLESMMKLAHAIDPSSPRAAGEASTDAPFNCVPVVVAPVLAKVQRSPLRECCAVLCSARAVRHARSEVGGVRVHAGPRPPPYPRARHARRAV